MPKKFTHLKKRRLVAERLGKAVVVAAFPEAEPLFTTHKAAKLLQVDPSSIAAWVDQGKIHAFRTPGGHRRIRRSDLIAFLKHYKMPVPARLFPDREHEFAPLNSNSRLCTYCGKDRLDRRHTV